MAISTVTNRVAYQGDGSSAVFSWPYRLDAQSDLALYTFNSSIVNGPLIVPQVINTHFTFSGSPDGSGNYINGGSVIFNSSPNAQTQIVIFRSSIITNEFAVPQFGDIPATSLTNETDYLTMLIQRAQDQAIRSVRLNDGFYGPGFDPTLPLNVQQAAGWALLVNSSATGFILSPVGSTLFTGILPVQYGGTGTGSSFALGNVIFAGSGGIYSTNTAFNWNIASSFLQISANSSTLGAAPGTMFRLVGQTDTLARSVIETFNSSAITGGGAFIARRSSGTPAAPLAVQTDMNLAYFGGAGFGATTYGLPVTGLSFHASQNWTDANQGSYATISTVANSTTASVEQFRLDQDGTPYFRKFGPNGAMQVGTGGVVTAGLLAVGNGGTGTGTSYIQYGIIFASSATQMATVPSAASGLVLVANGSSAPSFQSISAINAVVVKTSANTMAATESTLKLQGASFNQQLCDVTGNSGKEVTLVHNGSSLTQAYKIIGSGVGAAAQFIGQVGTSMTLYLRNESVKLQASNGGWDIVARKDNSPWAAFTPTITGFGSTSTLSFFYRRQGDSIDVAGTFILAVPQAALGTISLPGGLSYEAAKITISNATGSGGGMVVGSLTATNTTPSTQIINLVTAPLTSTSVVYLAQSPVSGLTTFVPTNVSSMLPSNILTQVKFTLPMAEWQL